MSYSKLFSSIVHSSLWTEEDHVRLLFVTLLAIADREGFVYGSRKGLERLANIDSQKYERDPWEVLMKPDADSSDLMRNPDNEGRRIQQVYGGFQILNYAYYRSLRNSDDRREQNREAQRRHRGKRDHWDKMSSQRKSAKVSNPSAEVSQGQPRSAQADAEAEADKSTIPYPSLKEGEVGDVALEAESSESTPDIHSKLKGSVFVKFCEWKTARRKMGGKIKDWDSMFEKQVEFLLKFSEAEQIEILEQSMRNGWVGLFPPNQSASAVKPKQPAPHYPKLPPRIEQSEEDREKAAAIAKEEAEKFRQQYST